MEQTDYISVKINERKPDGSLNPRDIDITKTEVVLQKLIKKATPSWSAIKDKDEWLSEIRGGVNE